MTGTDDIQFDDDYNSLLRNILGMNFVSEALSGNNVSQSEYKGVFGLLKKILETLSLGIEPDYSYLKNFDFTPVRREMVNVVKAMDESPMANVVTSAIRIMDVFHDNRFIEHLKEHLNSPNEWERRAAIEAICGYSGDWVKASLAELSANDPDEHVRFLAKARLSAAP